MASPSTKLAAFDLVQTPYKKVGDHEIRADLIIPQSDFKGKRPVIVRFHGGGLITGDSLTMEWFPQWLIDLAQKHNAIIASANYRLMPESTSLDIFDDVEDFWTWLHSSTVAKLLASRPTPTSLDLTRILTAGESAGGLLSVCLALSHPDEIRAATASYPCVDMASTHFSTPSPIPPVMDPPITASFVGDFLAQIQPGTVRSSAAIPDRFDLMIAAIYFGNMTALYERGVEEASKRALRYPIEYFDQADAKLPVGGVSILQGIEDEIVPMDGPEKFVAKAREVMRGKPGGDKIVLTLREGAHGFDGEVSLSEKWIQDHLRVAVDAWLA
ncbi:hypothetical protein FE257_006397 [Aspergillus nanangensis]|uniref:Alpha/beta hydrolase fold-3 domain-containing protein n=1 Tax=Aspergillus nanangensis TaxID=2582783 RepID=A0AAD4CZ74_ASPNN|nr:hypothetical protein FE257_006397 [Aspergillus nanangensis]